VRGRAFDGLNGAGRLVHTRPLTQPLPREGEELRERMGQRAEGGVVGVNARSGGNTLSLLRSFRDFSLLVSAGWHPRLHYVAPPELRGFFRPSVPGPYGTLTDPAINAGPSGASCGPLGLKLLGILTPSAAHWAIECGGRQPQETHVGVWQAEIFASR
jgi:hypothetical protein